MAQINKPSEHFNTTIWTGDSTTPKTFTTGTFKPDLLWGKIRTKTYAHQLYDTTRGAGNDKELVPSATNFEGDGNPETYGYVSAFTSTGFTFTRGTDSAGDDYWNESPDKYVAWTWKANGGTTSSNTDGSITSTVQANTTAGFSIVSYTGNGTAGATIGHGLGAKPSMMIIKNRSTASDWGVYHHTGGAEKYYEFNTNGEGDSTTPWNDTEPTTSVFSVGTWSVVNTSSDNYIAYIFSEKKGYSKFGRYTGNGSSDGTFVFCGFKPAFVVYKNISTTTDSWLMHDNQRGNQGAGANPQDLRLLINGTNTESDVDVDFLSNGFKLRATGAHVNTSGNVYLYMAFAEQPLVGTNNIPCTAR
jgi:hypothetical protein